MRSKKHGYNWANVRLTKAKKGKCVIAINEGKVWYLLSSSSLMKLEPEWKPVENREGWYFRIINKDYKDLYKVLTIF